MIQLPTIVPKGEANSRIEVIIGLFTGKNQFTETLVGACIEHALPKEAINVPIIIKMKDLLINALRKKPSVTNPVEIIIVILTPQFSIKQSV